MDYRFSGEGWCLCIVDNGECQVNEETAKNKQVNTASASAKRFVHRYVFECVYVYMYLFVYVHRQYESW